MDDAHTADWIEEIHKPANWYCDLDGHDFKGFPHAEKLYEHLLHDHQNISTDRREHLVDRNVLYMPREPSVCLFCAENISNVATESPLQEPFTSAQQPWEQGGSSKKKGKVKHTTRFEHISDSSSSEDNDNTALADTKFFTSQDKDAQSLEEYRSQINHLKLEKHIAKHLKSLAWISLRYFDEVGLPDGEKESALAGVGTKSQGSTSDKPQKSGDSDSGGCSLTFEDVPLDERVIVGDLRLETVNGAKDNGTTLSELNPFSEIISPETSGTSDITDIGNRDVAFGQGVSPIKKIVRAQGVEAISDSSSENEDTSAIRVLEDKLFSAFEISKFDERNLRFYPHGRLDELITRDAIEEVLSEQSNGEVDVHETVDFVMEQARKVFAIVVSCGISRVLSIMKAFRSCDFNDRCLPIEDPNSDASALRIFKSRLWNRMERSRFYDTQWQFLAPVFQ